MSRTSAARVQRDRLIDVRVTLVTVGSSAGHPNTLLSLILSGLALKIFDLLLRLVSDILRRVCDMPHLRQFSSFNEIPFSTLRDLASAQR